MPLTRARTWLPGLVLGAAMLSAAGACSGATGPSMSPRMLAVFAVDGLSIPASFACENAGGADSAAFRFNDGMLVLYADRSFRWEYSVSHLKWAGGTRSVVTDDRAVSGLHEITDGTIELRDGSGGAVLTTVTMCPGWFEMAHPRECPAGNAPRDLVLRLET